MEKEILTEKHSLWKGFIHRLDMELHHKFDNGEMIGKCNGDLCQSTKILKSLYNIDVDKTIEYFENKGGFCDCEVIMNVG